MTSTRSDRIDGISTTTAIKSACRVATTANIQLSGIQTIDGITLVADDRVLVKDQTDTADNGIYAVNANTWTRTKDFDGARDAAQATTVRVFAGSINAGSWWELTTPNPVVIGTDPLLWQQISIPASDANDYFTATSTTSLAIGTGAKVFTTQAGKIFADGAFLLISSAADPANYMHGQVTSYTSTTLTMDITNIGGSGTLADWEISVSGSRGATGSAGSGLANVVEDITPQLGGTLDTNAKLVQFSKGADIASAGALTLGTDGNYFDVTGTTAITSIVTTGKVGTVIKLHFDAALTLTHHATDLIIPGGANITTAAGDEAEFVEYAAGDFRCTNYVRASGAGIVAAGGSWTLLRTVTAANDATIDFVNGSGGVVLNSTYKAYAVIGSNIIVAVDNVELWLRTSTDAGSSYLATGYPYAITGINSNGTSANGQSAGVNQGTIIKHPSANSDIGNAAGESANFVLYFYEPSGTASKKLFSAKSSYVSALGYITQMESVFSNGATGDVDAIRFLTSSGNITSGTFSLYGIS